MMQSDVLAYLGLSFAPNEKIAAAYLNELWNGVQQAMSDSDVQTDNPIALLETIVEEGIARSGCDTIALPLTAGLDSRGLLGTLLKLYPADRIHCYTIGTNECRECIVASRTCQRLGVQWSRIDPNETPWDVDALVERARHIHRTHQAFIQVDAEAVFGRMAEMMPDNAVVVSGFLGGVAGGTHQSRSDGNSADPVIREVDTFIKRNQTWLWPCIDGERVRGYLTEFLQTNRHFLTQFSALSPLHLGFRQRLLIKAATCFMHRCWIAPYEDPRWIAYWLRQPFEHRADQRKYKSVLHAAFPEIFTDLSGSGVTRTISQRLIRMASLSRPLRQLMTKSRPVYSLAERGDPRVNASKERACRACAQSFDRRGILPTVSIEEQLDSMLKRPNAVVWNKVRWAVGAEIHLRAGNLECKTRN